MDFEGVKSFIVDKLTKELSPDLYYHDLYHTLDVLQAVERLVVAESISEREQIIVKTASLFHDSGMLITYADHEEASCELASALLPKYGYQQEVIDQIKKMIMTTKLPQSAENQLEMIICDADLDYLGRNDFNMISHRLKHEWDIHEIRKTTLKEWYKLQFEFLSNHQFFTRTAIETREMQKQQNLLEVIELLNGSAQQK